MVVAAVGPGITELGPIVGIFLLPAVLVPALLEQAELVAQAVAGQGDVAAGGAVQEAGSQSAQTAVAQRVVFNLLQNGQIHATLREQLLHLFENAKVIQIGVNQTANQILGRDIVSLAAVHTGALAVIPVIGNRHHHGFTQCLMQFLGCGLLQ